MFMALHFYRIEKLSFGDDHAGIIQPLEGDEKLTDISEQSIFIPIQIETCLGGFKSSKVKLKTLPFSDLMNFQYFIEIVPTEVHTLTGKKVIIYNILTKLAHCYTIFLCSLDVDYLEPDLKNLVGQLTITRPYFLTNDTLKWFS